MSDDPTLALRVHRRAQRWTRVSRGLYRSADCPELRAWQLVLPPSGRFTHLTAASELGWWLPPLPPGMPVVAAVGRRSTRPARAGLHVVRTDPSVPPHRRDGICLDAPMEVVLACARDLELLDLLVLTDSALRLGHCTRAELEDTAGTSRRGSRMLRRVLPLTDPRSESPWETVLRHFHVVCDVQVEPQKEFWVDGRFVARGDLWLSGTTAIHEYDGGDHLTRDQQQKDLKRARRLVEVGLDRRGYTSHDLLREPVGILRDIDRAIGRPHDPGRLRAWHDLLADSLLTRRGQERLLARFRIC